MDWRRALTQHWQYKVAALFVAVLLWVTVTTDEQQEQPVSTRVEWEVRDSSHVLVEAPGRVNTIFQARMGELMSFVGNAPVLRYAVDSVTSRRMRVSLGTDMIEYGQVGNARPVAVRPSDVVLHFEPRVERRVPLEPAVLVSAAEGFAVVDSPMVQPDSVTVSGAASEVRGIQELTTERLTLDGLTGRVSRDVPVSLPDEAPNVRADPRIVLVTADVDSVVERRLRRPVRPRGADAGSVVLEPDSATVLLRGPASVIDALSADSVTVSVDLSAGPGAAEGHELSVRVPERPGVTATVDPERVRARAGGGP